MGTECTSEEMKEIIEEKTESVISQVKELTYDEVAETVEKNVSSYTPRRYAS